jgi:hypothetical protein
MLSNWVWGLQHLLTGKPYTDIIESDGTISRLFSASTKPEDLKWHMDDEDRIVEPLHKTNWTFQFEDELPVPLNKPIFIKKHQWHRLIKGSGHLTVRITKICKT